MKVKCGILADLFLILMVVALSISCSKKEAIKTAPGVTVSEVTNITATSMSVSGTITTNGGTAVIARGFCWSTAQNPTVTDKITSNGTGDGSYTGFATMLLPGTTYYLKAYGTNSVGTGYSGQVTFTTLAIAPGLTTTELSALTPTSASGGGNIASDGGSPITARGVCWSTNQNPTISDTKTSDGAGTGTFISLITGLTVNVTYYVRAYATNSIGISYGNQIVVTTVANLPTLTTTNISSLTAVNAMSGGNITADGGGNITVRGVCWNTAGSPTVSESKTSDGPGTGIFQSKIAGLTWAKQYYVRAYATNSAGTAYGNEVTFSTPLALPGLSSKIIAFNDSWASSEGEVLTDGGAVVTARGICWSTTESPTIANFRTGEGSGLGSFSGYLTSLSPGTTYYLRSFATNSVGTNYGNSVSFTTQSVVQSIVVDIDSNVYHTITIGSQMWLTENLKVTKYNDGTPVPRATDGYEWATLRSAGYCWFNNDSISNKDTYGAMYNWLAVSSNKLSPRGWHIPSETEWTTLSDYLGGVSSAGNKLKESGASHWVTPNNGTNETRFTALPGGYRSNDGTYYDMGRNTSLWSSTLNYSTDYTTESWMRAITAYDTEDLRVISAEMHYGISVRCIKN